MSAIAGLINFFHPISPQTSSIMESAFSQKCIFKNTKAQLNQRLYMFCGSQDINNYKKEEVLPIFDEHNEIFITADCILDNYDELKSALELNEIISYGELIYYSYKKWGINCLKHFRGIFSIAIFDAKKNTIFLATDHTASRCLYYYKNASEVVFSTLLAPILALYPNIEVNDEYLNDFLMAPGLLPNVGIETTPHKDIFKLSPGEYIEITPTDLKHFTYWSPELNSNLQPKTAEEYGKMFFSTYVNAVNDAIISDKNIGIALSSGLDSASVGVLAAKHLELQNKKLYTYTYIPYEATENDPNHNNIHNETKDVCSIAAMYPNMVTHFINNNGRNCLEQVSEEIDILEIPFKAFINMPNLLELYDNAYKQGCNIVLIGQTGNSTVSFGYIRDILFDLYEKKDLANYLKYIVNYSKHEHIQPLKMIIGNLKYFNQLKKDNKRSLASKYARYNPYLSDEFVDGFDMNSFLNKFSIDPRTVTPTTEQIYKKCIYNKSMYVYLGEIETKIGLATGVIIRDPTKDMRIIQICNDIPMKVKGYNGIPRWLILSNFKDLIPRHILDNYNRYGVQNSDWYNRLSRDWYKLGPNIVDKLCNTTMSKYVDTEKIMSWYNETTTEGFNDSFDTLLYILILYVFSLWKEKQ